MKTLRSLLCITGLLASAWTASATPYASGVTNSGGTINWHLNESVTNGIVYVLFNKGTVSNYIGTNVLAGPQSFSLGAHTNFSINVFNVGTGSPHQISPASGNGAGQTPLVDFNGPRGIGINNNPSSPYFGTIYVANAAGGTDGVRTTQRGIYALNADFSDAFGYNTNAMPPVGTGAGQIQYGASTTYAPYRVFVGTDDVVYIADGDSSGTVGAGAWMTPPNLSSATNLFPFNGAAAGPGANVNSPAIYAQGSYNAGTLNLYTYEWGRSPYQDIWQYPFYSTPGTPLPLPWNLSTAPNELSSSGSCPGVYGYPPGFNPNTDVSAGIGSVEPVVGDFSMAPDGKFFCVEDRSSATGGNTAMWVYDSITNGNCLLWDSADQGGGVDPISTIFSVAVSPDNKYVAMGASSAAATGGSAANAGAIEYCALNYVNPNGTGGLPNLATLSTVKFNPAANEILRGVAFDAADNFYACSGSVSDTMRAFTLGLTTLAVTSGDATGTNGKFALNFAGATASVVAGSPSISQANTYGNPLNTTYTITLSAAQSAPTTVFFNLSGTATNGLSYTITGATTTNATSGSVVIPAGQTVATLTITPTSGGSAPTLTVTLTLSGSATVSPVPPIASTVAIANTGPQELAISGLQYASMYRGISNDFASFVITRYGDTNVASYTIPAAGFTYAGAASVNSDYAPGGSITVNQGDQIEIGKVLNPVSTGVYKGNESILVSLNGSAGQPVVPGLQTATLPLIDNANPPETVLWSDTLTNAADSVNWTLTFANSNLASTTVPPIVIKNYPNYSASNPDPNPLDDFDVEFGYPIANDGVGQSPVMIANGWTNALKMTANKIAGFVGGAHGAAAGVNVYPQGRSFSNNYAVRFSMNLSEGTTSTTEYNSFGINTYGTNCDWFASDVNASLGNATTNSDGIWYWVDSDTDGNGTTLGFVQVAGAPLPNTGYTVLTEVSALHFTNVSKAPPYNNVDAGSPADGFGQPANTWSDVEIKQFNGVVTLSINKTTLISYTNTAYANHGDVMLGYDDPYASVGTVASSVAPGAAVYYSNLRVVSLSGPTVTRDRPSGSQILITFTIPDTDATPASFNVQSASALGTPTVFANTAATITQSGVVFTAAVPYSASTVQQYYRIIQS